MTPTQSIAVCPLCLNMYLALCHHLKRSHYVNNIEERKLLLHLATGRVNIRSAPCPVLGCQYHSSRLDKHLLDGHPELNRDELAAEQQSAKRSVTLKLLADLRASNPKVPMASGLDMELVEEDEQVLQGVEENEEVCQNKKCARVRMEIKKRQMCLERMERASLLSLKKNQKLAKKLRNYQRAIKAQGEAGSRGEEEVKPKAGPSGEPSATPEAGPLEKEAKEGQKKIKNIFKGSGRDAAMRHLNLPKNMELFLEEYRKFHEGSAPTIMQKENALSNTSRVRSFLFYLSVGRKDLSNWLFLDNMEGIRSYASHLRKEGKAITTVNFYLRNIYQFCLFVKETPPKQCRLAQSQLTSVVRAVHAALKNLNKSVGIHQLRVKATKMNRIISRKSPRRCQELARDMIPALLQNGD